MSDIEDVIHFFEAEIENARKRKNSNNSSCFNGVEVGVSSANQLLDKHIWYCKSIIERIRNSSL